MQQTRWCLALSLMMLAAACGDGQPDTHTAKVLWGTLAASQVARPFALEELTQTNAAINPRCPGGGEARGELWHTAYQTGPEGEASGSAHYTLSACRALHQDLAVDGQVQRGFKIRRQMELPPDADAPRLGLMRHDAFTGALHLSDGSRCAVDLVRSFENGAYAFAGTLCSHDVNALGIGEKPTP